MPYSYYMGPIGHPRVPPMGTQQVHEKPHRGSYRIPWDVFRDIMGHPTGRSMGSYTTHGKSHGSCHLPWEVTWDPMGRLWNVASLHGACCWIPWAFPWAFQWAFRWEVAKPIGRPMGRTHDAGVPWDAHAFYGQSHGKSYGYKCSPWKVQ